MWTQPKALPQQSNDVLPGGQVSQQPVAGTIPRGGNKSANEAFYTGFENGKHVASLPETISVGGQSLSTKTDLEKILQRGKERFTIFCSHCHGQLGDGKGMIALRGLELRRPPASYHTDRLRQMPIGHFFDVQTHGFGAMFSYAARVDPDDRWAIAAYIRALQLSQNAKGSDIQPQTMNTQPQESGG
jgi:mono/diheme cytochrome c family protein